MADKKLLFDDEVLGEICARHLNKPTKEMMEGLEADLREYYGPIISTDQPWISAPAGGLFYHLKLLFHWQLNASLILPASPRDRRFRTILVLHP